MASGTGKERIEIIKQQQAENQTAKCQVVMRTPTAPDTSHWHALGSRGEQALEEFGDTLSS